MIIISAVGARFIAPWGAMNRAPTSAMAQTMIMAGKLQVSKQTGFNEAGRLQLLDANGLLVNETLFYADKADGTKLVSVSVPEGFTQVIFSAGAENHGEFVYGGYGNQAGNGFGTSPYSANGSTHGSDYLVDSVEFGFGHVEITGVPNHAETLSA